MLQEKNQIALQPQPDEDDGTAWKSFESQRRTTRALGVEMPSINLENQNPMSRSLAGSSDFSQDANTQAMQKGFTRGMMSCCDDSCGNECAKTFYGEVVEDGKAGFAERNNYLDRL